MTSDLSEIDSIVLKAPNDLSSSESESEKSKLFSILKSFFAIFDPECKGAIDINELDVLGASNSEILNDVLNYIRLNRSSKILKTVNPNLRNPGQRHSLYIEKKPLSSKFLVTYEEIVNAAEVVLDRRKQTKILQSRTSGTTLSQAFESHTNSTSQSNANSLDLNSLIDKENYLLKQGLDSIDCIRKWLTNQLIDNKVKQTNLSKLKYQNLYSIDKLLIDLKQLSDLNLYLNDFLFRKKISMEKSVKKEDEFCLPDPPSYQDYLEQFGFQNSKQELDLDKFLKEKQEKIESLQKEKSNLIRKLFEIKAESENLNKNMSKLNGRNFSRQNSLVSLAKETQNVGEKNFADFMPSYYQNGAKNLNNTMTISKPRFL
ncbi:hypothetical protein BpHYR1_028633 [Brachionus plicatilis]|uniref:Uncharacterized protein n=1 Tax=Brachionus plicatilis TaxID=10195 RepID=A0A3M7RCK8_BRAPC|nr:hypothetical protein BpHYR1_028633 [Brachionus plicatilis]